MVCVTQILTISHSTVLTMDQVTRPKISIRKEYCYGDVPISLKTVNMSLFHIPHQLNNSNIFSATDLVCCDDTMIQIMEDSFILASGLFGRCETCMKNFQKSICSFTCSPEHSKFLTGFKDTVTNDDEEEGTYIYMKKRSLKLFINNLSITKIIF